MIFKKVGFFHWCQKHQMLILLFKNYFKISIFEKIT
jgi:hypothetical protein